MSPGRRRWPRTVRRLAELLIVGFILEYFVVPQIGGTHKAIHVLASANPFLPVLGLALEALSAGRVLRADPVPDPQERRPGLRHGFEDTAVDLGAQPLRPGGNAAASTLSYRLLTRAGSAVPTRRSPSPLRGSVRPLS